MWSMMRDSPGSREKTAKLATREELMTSALVVRMRQANGTKYNPVVQIER